MARGWVEEVAYRIVDRVSVLGDGVGVDSRDDARAS